MFGGTFDMTKNTSLQIIKVILKKAKKYLQELHERIPRVFWLWALALAFDPEALETI